MNILPTLISIFSALLAAAPVPGFAAAPAGVVLGGHGAIPRGLRAGSRISPGQVISVPPGGLLELRLSGGTVVTLGDGARMKVGKQAAVPPTLEGGTVRVRVPRDAPTDTVFHTLNGEIRAPRGGDFQAIVSEQGIRTAVIAYAGEATLGPRGAGARVTAHPGELTGLTDSSSGSQPKPAVKISPAQLRALRFALGVDPNPPRAEGDVRTGTFISPVPPGVPPRAVALRSPFGGADSVRPPTPGQPPGGFLDVRSGLYVAPAPGSMFDPVNRVYVPGPASGSFEPRTGAYVPPPGKSASEVIAANGALRGMTAAPLAPGADPAKVGSTPPAPMDRVAALPRTEGSRNRRVPFETNGRPDLPVYDPTLCPPYCNPQIQPDFVAPGRGAPGQTGTSPNNSTVIFSVQ